MIEQRDASRPTVDSSEPSEAVKEFGEVILHTKCSLFMISDIKINLYANLAFFSFTLPVNAS